MTYEREGHVIESDKEVERERKRIRERESYLVSVGVSLCRGEIRSSVTQCAKGKLMNYICSILIPM